MVNYKDNKIVVTGSEGGISMDGAVNVIDKTTGSKKQPEASSNTYINISTTLLHFLDNLQK